MKLQILLFSILITILTGCSDGEEVLKEQTVIQLREEIAAQNQNREERSIKLDEDLTKRRAFISAIEGEFEGEFVVKQSIYLIRFIITPTIPDYDVDRIRTLAEVEYELQNLNINIQIMQWNPNNELSAVGCILENIKPDLKRGILNIISESCNNTYQLILTEGESDKDMYIESREMANLIKEGRVTSVGNFKGKLRSSTNAKIFNFSLDRI